VLVARRFVFFDFNLKAEALILAALGLRWPRVRGNENGFLSPRSFRITRGTAGLEEDRNHTRRLVVYQFEN
jgi:hypothetical protein